MDLQTGQFITRPKVVEIPITDVVINHVGKMAKEQVFKSLKIYNLKKKEIIFPGVNLAGVDHHQQQIEKIEENKDD